MKDNSRFFSNRECEYYPCHRMPDGGELNCLFCYCPLYALGSRCGGDYKITDKGVKSCASCTVCHGRDGYERVMDRIGSVLELAKKEL